MPGLEMRGALDADELHPSWMWFGERADLIVAINDGLAGLAPRQQCLNLGPHRDAAACRIASLTPSMRWVPTIQIRMGMPL